VADEPRDTNDTSRSGAGDHALGGVPRIPPPSPELLALVARGGPVRTRRPLRTVAVVALASVLWAAAVLVVLGVRPDLAHLPLAANILYGLVCLTGFVAQLTFALVPSPGRVLPTAHESARSSLVILAITVPLAMVMAGAQGVASACTAVAWRAGVTCAGAGLAVAALPTLAGLSTLRRIVPGGAWRTSLSLGAAAGILAGLTLQLHCGHPGLVHLVVAHGFALVAPAALLALLHRR
jgi:hypothetical protein